MARRRRHGTQTNTSAKARDDQPKKVTLTLGVVVAGLVVLLFAGFIWGMFQIAAWIGIATVALDLDDYRPANFVVSSVVYEPPTRRQPATYYARGLVDGKYEERFALSGVVPEMRSREELEAHLGQRPVTFKVMYNRNRTEWMIGNDTMRVQPFHENFVEMYRNTALSAAFHLLLSVIAIAAALLGLRIATGSHRQR